MKSQVMTNVVSTTGAPVTLNELWGAGHKW